MSRTYIFESAEDGVDPRAVPFQTTYTGARIPGLGLGTFGSDRFMGEQIADAVVGAAEVGYRHFDCAAVYGNEQVIGPSFQAILRGGVKRDELWVTSKLWNDRHAADDVVPACRQSLGDLGLDYLDLYLVHWPFPNYHRPGCDVEERDPHAQPYVHDNYMKTWRQMEKLVDIGLVRHIGVSNVTVPKLTRILADARIKPAVNEMELHPHFQQPELFQFTVDNAMVPIGYSPIGSPNRPERDTTPEDTVDIEDPVIVRIAERLGVRPGIVCIKWAVQRGQIPIPFSVKRHQYLGALQAITGAKLTDQDMAEIAGIDKNCRLIKGHVFLWEGAKDWHDLWDEDGAIAWAGNPHAR